MLTLRRPNKVSLPPQSYHTQQPSAFSSVVKRSPFDFSLLHDLLMHSPRDLSRPFRAACCRVAPSRVPALGWLRARLVSP